MSDAVLDNVVWHALTTIHARFAEGTGRARRYAGDVSVFAAIEHDDAASWDDLRRVAAGTPVVLFSAVHGDPPPGWEHLGGGAGDQMVLDALAPAPTTTVKLAPLSDAHVPAMLELVEVAQPGPFEARTVALGGYVGAFDDDGALLAMAGTRMQTAAFVEISAVCTHPDARGRGLAAAVSHRVASDILDGGKQPILHVAHGNDNAKRVYDRLGFVTRRTVRVDRVAPPQSRSGGASSSI